MALTTRREAGLPSTSYYAPDYRVEVEGQELDPEVKGDILDLKVVLDLENMASCEFNVSNWDDTRLKFKYSDTAAFDVGNRIHVRMGYADRLLSMVVGQISTLAPKFPQSGEPTITVSGLDGMLLLRDSRPAEGETKKYENMADWQIAQQVAQRNNLNANVTQEGEAHELVIQKNQDDAQFLKERAARSDRNCYVLTDPDTGEATLYFVKPTDGRDSGRTRVYVFEWGKTLMSFSPRLTLSNQVASVTVRGWNPRTKEPIVYTATSADLQDGGEGANGPAAAAEKLGGKQDMVVDAPVASEQEARDLAISLLSERAYEFITGSGQVIGIPDLRPGDNVDLEGLGRRFSGRYYVKKVEHSLSPSAGYLTNFVVRRVFDGGLES